MVIAVLNNSGNVGKTTITRELLSMSFKGKTKVVEIEGNCSGSKAFANSFDDYVCVTPDDFIEIYSSIVEADEDTNLILDIGASSIVVFLRKLREYSGVSDFVDMFIVPTTREAKQLKDTINTAIMLNKLFNVDGSKITLLPNRADAKTFTKDFSPLMGAAKEYGFNTGIKFAIPEISILKDLEIAKRTILEMVEDETDYTQKIRATKGTTEQKKWIKRDLSKRKATKVQEELNGVANEILNVINLNMGAKEEEDHIEDGFNDEEYAQD